MPNQLAEDFLRDLDASEGSSDEDAASNADGGGDDTDMAEDESQFVIPDAVALYIEARQRPKEALTALLENPQFNEFLEELRTAIEKGSSAMSEEDLSRSLLVDNLTKCNAALAEVDQEILTVYRHIRDIYNKRFPELETIVTAPLDYVAAVTGLQNDLDMGLVYKMDDILPNPVIMQITVAMSVTVGHRLSQSELQRVLNAAEEVNKMVECRKVILNYIEVHMGIMAPNLTALAGPSLAARLVTHGGSLKQLADMPAQNILNVGGSAFSKAQSAFSHNSGNSVLPNLAKRSGRGYGVIWHSDIVQNAPKQLKGRALRLMAGKCGIAARSDYYKYQRSDAIGKKLREKILQTLKKHQEPPPPQMKKILPIPDERPRARRGGKRHRRAKEKYGMSELQRQANRLQFGLEAEGDYGLDEVEPGLGMIGSSATGRLRGTAKEAQRVRSREVGHLRKGILMDLI